MEKQEAQTAVVEEETPAAALLLQAARTAKAEEHTQEVVEEGENSESGEHTREEPQPLDVGLPRAAVPGEQGQQQ